MDNDKPTTLTGFTAKTQGEIDRHLFAAKTGGLVSLGAASFWELFSAATAWHEYAKKMTEIRANKAAEEKAGGEESERILQGARDVTGCKHLRTAPVMGLSDPFGEQTMRCLDCGFEFVLSPLAPQARDTTPSEEA